MPKEKNKSMALIVKSAFSRYGGYYNSYGFPLIKEKIARFRDDIFQKASQNNYDKTREALKKIDEIEEGPYNCQKEEEEKLSEKRKRMIGKVIENVSTRLEEASISPDSYYAIRDYKTKDIVNIESLYGLSSVFSKQISTLSSEINSKINPRDRETIERFHVGENIDFNKENSKEDR